MWGLVRSPDTLGGRTESYQEVHHVGLVVPQCLDSMKDIHSSLVSEHLTDNADGTERAATAPSIPVGEEMRWLGSVGYYSTSHTQPLETMV